MYRCTNPFLQMRIHVLILIYLVLIGLIYKAAISQSIGSYSAHVKQWHCRSGLQDHSRIIIQPVVITTKTNTKIQLYSAHAFDDPLSVLRLQPEQTTW